MTAARGTGVGGQIYQKPAARRDLLEHAEFIADQSLDAAERFLFAVERTFQHLADMPELGSRWKSVNPKTAEIRVWRIEGFEKHLVFYRALEGGIEVVRIIHGSRDIETLFADDLRAD